MKHKLGKEHCGQSCSKRKYPPLSQEGTCETNVKAIIIRTHLNMLNLLLGLKRVIKWRVQVLSSFMSHPLVQNSCDISYLCVASELQIKKKKKKRQTAKQHLVCRSPGNSQGCVLEPTPYCFEFNISQCSSFCSNILATFSAHL